MGRRVRYLEILTEKIIVSTRRDNRIATVQFLYMWDINPSNKIEADMAQFFGDQDKPRDYYVFAEELVLGIHEHIEEIDGIILEYTQNWDFKRIAKIDLAILRLAIFEMLYRHDVPPIVSINEAIDLSKIFSIEDAKRFINGILDEFKLKLRRPLREASPDG